jgi:hypothetical protein
MILRAVERTGECVRRGFVRLLLALAAAAWLSACKPSSEYDKTPELIHAPPLRELNPKQLHALSMECEKYLPGRMARGPYDAAYCEAAIAAWSDSPIQMIQIPPAPGADR